MTWRTFKFFEFEELKDPESNIPYDKLKDLGITCCACGRGQMIFGDAGGMIYILMTLQQMISFPAYELRVNFIYQLKQHNYFLTVGEDEEMFPMVRVWNFDKRTKEGNPSLARNIRPYVGGNSTSLSSVMAISAHENMNLIAVGFKNGTVNLIRGNIARDRQSRLKTVYTDKEEGYVTGLGFRQVGNNIHLMISTSHNVCAVQVSNNDKLVMLDVGIGCQINCSTMTDHTQDYKFVIARNEAIHFYTSEAKAQCLVFEGEKFLTRWYRGYLISVTFGGRVGGGRAAALTSSQGASSDTMTLTIYDIQNQFVAYQTTFTSRVIDVLSEWGSLYVLLKDGRMIRLEENDTKTKLETLFKKNLYPTAISLARSQSYNDGLIDIFTQYGDHLYSKGDYDAAITQYISTIGKLEPSYVIRKFLDAQRIHNLTDYLKALHEKGQANADHTTLLLNCYTKLKDIDQLDKFVQVAQSLTFDVETAIKVFRQANYHRHALALAKKYQKHEWCLKIQLEDQGNCHDAVEYIEHLPFEEAEKNLERYGKQLMSEMPAETTSLLNKLCSDWIPKGVEPSPDSFISKRSDPSYYIRIFVDNKKRLMDFLETQIQNNRQCKDSVYTTLLELYLGELGSCPKEERGHKEQRAMQLLKRPEATYDVEHALVLAKMHDFRDGILYLYEKTNLFQQIMHYYMEHNDYDLVMDTCERHGRKDPNLWVQALSYFASKDNCQKQIVKVLQHVEDYHLMPPLMVVQTLAESSCSTLSDIKPYVVRHLKEVNEQIAKDEQLIKQYREDTRKMREQIKKLETTAQVFQIMKCGLCMRPLSLPAVHFLCEHSFHQHCLDDEFEHECPICSRDNRKVLDVIQQQAGMTDLHEQFHAQLTRSHDGFSVVADYFGRGVFNKPKSGSSK